LRDEVPKPPLPFERPQAAHVCGMRIAEKIIVAALERFPGVYLITPFFALRNSH